MSLLLLAANDVLCVCFMPDPKEESRLSLRSFPGFAQFEFITLLVTEWMRPDERSTPVLLVACINVRASC